MYVPHQGCIWLMLHLSELTECAERPSFQRIENGYCLQSVQMNFQLLDQSVWTSVTDWSNVTFNTAQKDSETLRLSDDCLWSKDNFDNINKICSHK